MVILLDSILERFNKPLLYKQKRPSLNPLLRKQVYERDGYKCVFCKSSQRLDEEQLDIAHLIPVIFGGQDNIENLVTSCYPCHILFDKPEHKNMIKIGIVAKKKAIAEGKDTWRGRGKDKKLRKRPIRKIPKQEREE